MEGGGRFCSFRWDDKQSFALSELESESGKKTGVKWMRMEGDFYHDGSERKKEEQ